MSSLDVFFVGQSRHSLNFDVLILIIKYKYGHRICFIDLASAAVLRLMERQDQGGRRSSQGPQGPRRRSQGFLGGHRCTSSISRLQRLQARARVEARCWASGLRRRRPVTPSARARKTRMMWAQMCSRWAPCYWAYPVLKTCCE